MALVYAIGECDMDTGIRGRYTSKMLRELSKRKDVKAVVLRADSPGGDALPSDMVAQGMSDVSKKKPMIVSQGEVAASGGYWISMNGDRIFTSPYTITGSIGVIGGWLWNEKVSEKTGLTADHVQVGEHADLGFGITIPFIGVEIPDRNLSEYEHARMRNMILGSYHDFVGKVAAGRHLDTTYVDSIGQGRVWSGPRAIELKLVDEIGGLDDALAYARTKANLPAQGRDVEIIEYPPRQWFNPAALLQSPMMPAKALGFVLSKSGEQPLLVEDNYELSVLRRIARRPGEPLHMVAPEDIPAEDRK